MFYKRKFKYSRLSKDQADLNDLKSINKINSQTVHMHTLSGKGLNHSGVKLYSVSELVSLTLCVVLH